MIDIKDRRITLIGGAGFIGHNLALYLKSHGADVSVVDGLSVNNLLYLHATNQEVPFRETYIKMVEERLKLMRKAQIPLFVEDARDYNSLSHTIGKTDPEVLVILAAVSHAGRSNKNPFDTFDHSLRTLENALDTCQHRERHVIYFSSSMIYGHFNGESVTEETECNPIGIYGSLKLAGEKMVQAYNNVFGTPYMIVRPSALYGERCISRRVGQIFIENAVKGKEITLNGDGSDRLDFTYIRDLVDGIKKVIENENSRNQTFNLTYGESRSLAQMADIIRDHFPDIDVRYVPKDNLTPDRGTLSVDKAKEMIGYNPQYPLERGFVEYIDWYRSFFSEDD